MDRAEKHHRINSQHSAPVERQIITPKVVKESVNIGKRVQKKPVEIQSDDEHDETWKKQNLIEIEKEDKEIAELERKLGLKTDKKRRDRSNKQIELEGLGIGFMSFLDKMESKVKMNVKEYKAP